MRGRWGAGNDRIACVQHRMGNAQKNWTTNYYQKNTVVLGSFQHDWSKIFSSGGSHIDFCLVALECLVRATNDRVSSPAAPGMTKPSKTSLTCWDVRRPSASNRFIDLVLIVFPYISFSFPPVTLMVQLIVPHGGILQLCIQFSQPHRQVASNPPVTRLNGTF